MLEEPAVVKAILAKQITSESDVRGNLVKAVHQSWTCNALLLIFDDGRWATYDCVCPEWEGESGVEFSTDVHLADVVLLLHAAGRISKAIYDAWEDWRLAYLKTEKEKEQYEEYLELKKRFCDEKEAQDGEQVST